MVSARASSSLTSNSSSCRKALSLPVGVLIFSSRHRRTRRGRQRWSGSCRGSFRLVRTGAGRPGGPAEPVREARGADAGVIAGYEGVLVNVDAVVGRVDVGHDVPRVALRAQEAPDELIQREPFGTA